MRRVITCAKLTLSFSCYLAAARVHALIAFIYRHLLSHSDLRQINLLSFFLSISGEYIFRLWNMRDTSNVRATVRKSVSMLVVGLIPFFSWFTLLPKLINLHLAIAPIPLSLIILLSEITCTITYIRMDKHIGIYIHACTERSANTRRSFHVKQKNI